MVIRLRQGRNDLHRYIEFGTHRYPLDELLIEGRFLQSDFHDTEGCRDKHMHWYRKVLRTYDPERDVVLLSKQGSRRLVDNLDEPDKEFSTEELYEESLTMRWKVRPKDHELF